MDLLLKALPQNLNDIKDQELRDYAAEYLQRVKVNPLSLFEPLPYQDRFNADESKIKAIFGGNRSGKTEDVSSYIIKKCLAKPKQRWWACAETFPDSVNVQQRKVWELLPKNRIKYGRYDEVNGFTNRKLIFDNGSLVVFKSYDQGVESFASDDVDGIWDDEEPPIEIVKESRMRLLDRNGEMLFSMTSVKGVTELISEVFDDADIIESQYAPLVNETLPRIAKKNGMTFYFLWTTENPYINQARVIQETKLMTREEIKCRIYGIPINLIGRIYPQFNKLIHLTRLDDMPVDPISGDFRHYVLYHVLDPHDRKPWAMCWIALHRTGTGYVVDEYPNRNFNEMQFDDKTYDDYAKVIREKEENLREIFGCSVRTRIIDPNFGNKTVQLAERQGGQSTTTPQKELAKRGFRFNDGIDSLEAGHLAVRQRLFYQKAGEEIVVQPSIMVLENCINTITHLQKYSYKDIFTASGEEKPKVGPRQEYKDFCDLVRYWVMSNPRYQGINREVKNPGKVY